MVFLPFKNQFNRDNDKYIETCKARALAGSKGGKAKVANASKCKQVQANLANLADSDSKNKSDSKKESKKESKRSGVRFTPPSLEDVKAYCLERKNHVNPENFINHYEASNWYRGKTKMKDWKAAVRTWENNSYSKPAKPSSHNLSGKTYESGDL